MTHLLLTSAQKQEKEEFFDENLSG